jgi:threonylcarbamoyladenosine tRNA methylthiotransferase MtaB
MSDRKSRQIIRRAKKIYPNAFVIVTGCYAQTSPDDIKKIDGVNLIVGTEDKNNILSLYEQYKNEEMSLCTSDIMKTHTFTDMTVESCDRVRAYIKVQEGCNQFCSYCIIPYARGPIRSRNFDEVINETKRLANNGFSEITYVGIHIASYGLDTHSQGLAELLVAANKIENIKRIRLSSIEPMTLNERFIEKIKDCDKLCHHFHLSLQSGCDETLARMNRKYTTAQYKSICDGLKKHFPDVAITTDIMVGFAGETEEEFKKTCEFVNEIAFADAHIFQYSQRKGTPADKYENQVNAELKDKRSKIIQNICENSKNEFMTNMLGKTCTVLFEQDVSAGVYEGKTDNYQNVLVKSDEDISGKYIDVTLIAIENGSFIGKIV